MPRACCVGLLIISRAETKAQRKKGEAVITIHGFLPHAKIVGDAKELLKRDELSMIPMGHSCSPGLGIKVWDLGHIEQ